MGLKIEIELHRAIDESFLLAWESHATHTMEYWRREVAEGQTRLGYLEWLSHKLEDADDREADDGEL